MAVQIYYQLIRDIVIDEQLLSMLQPQRRKQLFSFRLESDQKRCAAAGLLLWKHIYNKHPERFTVSYNAAGKPSVANAPFLTSHTAMILSCLPSVTPLLDVILKSFIKLSFHTMFFIQMSFMHFLIFLQEIYKTMSFFACGQQRKPS